MEQAPLKDIHPTIIVDRNYGKRMGNFDIDPLAIAGYLRERGIADEAIAKLEITFHDEEKISDQGGSVRTLGEFDSKTKKIDTYRAFDAFDAAVKDLNLSEVPQSALYLHDETVSKELNSTLVHELEHFIDDNEGSIAEEVERHEKQYKGKISRVLGKYALLNAGVGLGVVLTQSTLSHVNEQLDAAVSAHPGVTSALFLGIAASAQLGVSMATRKRRNATIMEIRRKKYETSPLEAKARAAEQDHGQSFVSVTHLQGESL